jgi:hypothetical protein
MMDITTSTTHLTVANHTALPANFLAMWVFSALVHPRSFNSPF